MKAFSKYVSFAEGTQTKTGILNLPNEKQRANIELLCTEVFDKVREHFGVPIKINSVFRSELVNKAVGGAESSQHRANNGAAIDIDDTYGKVTNKQIFEYIKHNLVYDQLISEKGTLDKPAWIHVSYKQNRNRKQILRIP